MMPIEPHRRALAAKGRTMPPDYWPRYAQLRLKYRRTTRHAPARGGCKSCQIITERTDNDQTNDNEGRTDDVH